MKTISRIILVCLAMVIALWAAPSAISPLASIGAPTAAHAINGPTCGGANDGERIVDTGGITWECNGNIGQWVQVT